MRRVTLEAAHIKRALASYRHHLLLASSSLPPFEIWSSFCSALLSCARSRVAPATSWLKCEVWRLYTWLASEKALAYIELLSTPGQAIDLPPKSPQHFVSFLASRMLGATAAHLRDPAARASVLPRTDELTPQGPRDWATGAFLDCSGLTPQVLHALPIMDTRSLATREFIDNTGVAAAAARGRTEPLLPRRGHGHGARARERRLQLALRARVPVDPCARAQFMLGHLDLNPWCARPSASDTDWEMALMAARCVLPAAATAVVQAFRDALNHWCEHDILLHRGVDRRHDRLGDDADGAAVARRVLLAIEVARGAPANAQHEPRQRFTEVVGLGCEGADAMQVWLDEAADRAVSVVNALVLSRKIK
ncbi:hypothetical protein GGX14DRAFT_571056 [Mycena pura]|uniref:Uncharacterized protein n=1 Tax=Mycena pura TaxID=153505 RepID=A0AAD6V3D0_9AGAR|nr:hypothetical protein GGX14DRAFT_571056 [Mycena pura]